jgi:hypothetical protein
MPAAADIPGTKQSRRDLTTPPSGLRLLGAGKEIVIRGGLSSGTRVVAAILGGAVGIGLLFIFFNPRPETIPRNAPLLLLSAAGVLTCWMAMQLLATDRLFFCGDEIVHERRIAQVCWRRRRISRQEHTARIQPVGSNRGVMISGSGQQWIVGRRLDASGREWLRAWLAQTSS